MSSYLYGASVQGIQDFIFETNKLKEIIGASEIVISIDKLNLKEEFNLQEEPTIILSAAGNIRAIFNNKEDLEKVVLNLPKKIMQEAYGITVSQAVVKDTNNYKIDSKELEKKLKIQRNIPSVPLDMNLSILARNSKTGKPALATSKDSEDKASYQKIKIFEEYVSKNKNMIYDISKIKNSNGKIAIIHIDGNGLGNIVKDLNKEEMKKFSNDLDKATKDSFDTAKEVIKSSKFREVILSGDDVTLICDATYAVEFSLKFLEEFEKNTKNIYKNLGLTACGGITFCNEKYPIHYALKLAEELCSHAKKHSKELSQLLAPSSLMFHNIQSSNVDNFEKFIDDELTINDKRLDYGPYYLNVKNKPAISILLEVVQEFQKDNSPKGRLRDYLNDLRYDEVFAQNQLKRVEQMWSVKKWENDIFSKFNDNLNLTNLFVQKDKYKKTPLYDILQLCSVKGDEK